MALFEGLRDFFTGSNNGYVGWHAPQQASQQMPAQQAPTARVTPISEMNALQKFGLILQNTADPSTLGKYQQSVIQDQERIKQEQQRQALQQYAQSGAVPESMRAIFQAAPELLPQWALQQNDPLRRIQMAQAQAGLENAKTERERQSALAQLFGGGGQVQQQMPEGVYGPAPAPKQLSQQEMVMRAAQIDPERYGQIALRSLSGGGSGGGGATIAAAERLMAEDPTLDFATAFSIAKSGLGQGMTFSGGALQAIGGADEAFRARESAKTEGRKIGEARGVEVNDLLDRQSSMPQLIDMTKRLSNLGKAATYTMTGRARDTFMREMGMDVPDSATARKEYISMVDNEILPLLRQTFGAQFTEKEGQSLKQTLGDTNASPAEKDAVIRSFIRTKMDTINTKSRRLGMDDIYTQEQIQSAVSGIGSQGSKNRIKFDAQGNIVK